MTKDMTDQEADEILIRAMASPVRWIADLGRSIFLKRHPDWTPPSPPQPGSVLKVR